MNPLEWHDGNRQMHELMRAGTRENPTSANLTPFRAQFLQVCNLFAVGTLDSRGRPWTSLWGGEDGSISVYNLQTTAIKTLADQKFDPVLARLQQVHADKGVCGKGQPISGLGLRLSTRDRVKLSGVVLGALLEDAGTDGVANASVVVQVETSLGNCPKYLNIKEIRPSIPDPVAHPSPLPLPAPALELVRKADVFFISAGLSTNYRGGPHGFIRVLSNKPDLVQLAYPEYSGNRLYQTLGNLFVEPLAGIVIPDFQTGDALYATCEATILAGSEAGKIMPRTNLVVILTIKDAQFVQRSLPFRAIEGEPSPYNPPLRLLAEEGGLSVPPGKPLANAELIDREMLSDDIGWLKFKVDEPITYEIGQHIALNFETDLGMGYSHMRDDDPTSLNDDLNRSFTITSSASGPTNTFELVLRKVGRVTKHLIKENIRGGISCSVLGFGGSFAIEQSGEKTVGFLAGGVGITPILCQAESLDQAKIHLVWTINQKDAPFAKAACQKWPLLAKAHIFVSGAISKDNEALLRQLEEGRTHVERRRLRNDDFHSLAIERWYVCAGPALQKSATEWLQSKEVISESFNF